MDWKNKTVVVTGSEKPSGAAVAEMLKEKCAEVYTIQSNVEDLENDIQWINSISGNIDALFCDSTVADPGLTATELSPGIIRDIMRKSAYLCWKSARYCVPLMRSTEGSAIVFITNNSIRHPKKRNIVSSICSTSVESITKNFASEVASRGIRICTVMHDENCDPLHVAGSAVFLASDEASYITGTAVEVSEVEEA